MAVDSINPNVPVVTPKANAPKDEQALNIQRFNNTKEGQVEQEPKVSFKQTPDTFTCNHELKAKSGKKWCIGLMSTFTPGMGHFANGQLGKAILSLLGITAGGLMTFFSGALQSKVMRSLTAVAGLALAGGTYIWQIVNSVKNAAKNVEIVDANPINK